jgi:hypothetical protein
MPRDRSLTKRFRRVRGIGHWHGLSSPMALDHDGSVGDGQDAFVLFPQWETSEGNQSRQSCPGENGKG